MPNYYCKVNGQESGPHDVEVLRSWFQGGFLKPNDPVWVDGEYGRSPAWAYPEIVGNPTPQQMQALGKSAPPETESQAAGKRAVVHGLELIGIATVIYAVTSAASGGAVSLIAIGPAVCGVGLLIKGWRDILK